MRKHELYIFYLNFNFDSRAWLAPMPDDLANVTGNLTNFVDLSAASITKYQIDRRLCSSLYYPKVN